MTSDDLSTAAAAEPHQDLKTHQQHQLKRPTSRLHQYRYFLAGLDTLRHKIEQLDFSLNGVLNDFYRRHITTSEEQQGASRNGHIINSVNHEPYLKFASRRLNECTFWLEQHETQHQEKKQKKLNKAQTHWNSDQLYVQNSSARQNPISNSAKNQQAATQQSQKPVKSIASYEIIDGQVKLANIINRIKEISTRSHANDSENNGITKNKKAKPEKSSVLTDVKSVANTEKTFLTDEVSGGSQCVQFLMDFWENLKYTVEMIQHIEDRFDREILFYLKRISRSNRLESGERNANMAAEAEPVIQSNSAEQNKEETKYSEEKTRNKQIAKQAMIDGKEKCLDSKLLISSIERLQLQLKSLARSSGSSLESNLLHGRLTDMLCSECDPKFPLLRLIPALTERLDDAMRLTETWINSEVEQLEALQHQIKDRRAEAVAKQRLVDQQHRLMGQLLRSLQRSHLAYQNNKRRLTELANELDRVQTDLETATSLAQNHSEKSKTTQSRLAFYSMNSVGMRRKGFAVQYRKKQLLQELSNLQSSLSQIDHEIEELRKKSSDKLIQFTNAEQTFNSSEENYRRIKLELDENSQNFRSLHNETKKLNENLQKMQRIHTLKSSPEYVDILLPNERSVSELSIAEPKNSDTNAISHISKSQSISHIVLAPSLKDKIKLRMKIFDKK